MTSGKPYEEVNNGELYIKVSDMNIPGNETSITTSEHFVSENNSGRIPKYSIIFPKRGGAIATNKKRIVVEREIYVDLNTMGMTVIKPEIFPYVKVWFDSMKLDELQTGTSIPQINNKDIYPLLIPIPPLKEQKRIVHLINEAEEKLSVIDEFQTMYEVDREILKSKLIDAGIQGKLTEQLPEDGTAEELLEQIAKEKKQLIKEKKIKVTKALPEITEDEIPFEIPGNWKWVRLSEVMDVRDGTHDSPKYVKQGIPLVTSKNISSGGLDFSNVNYINQEDANKINERSNVDTGDILFAMIGTIGNPVIVEKDREFCIKM